MNSKRFTYRRLHLTDANANEYDGSVLLHSKGRLLIEPISKICPTRYQKTVMIRKVFLGQKHGGKKIIAPN